MVKSQAREVLVFGYEGLHGPNTITPDNPCRTHADAVLSIPESSGPRIFQRMKHRTTPCAALMSVASRMHLFAASPCLRSSPEAANSNPGPSCENFQVESHVP